MFPPADNTPLDFSQPGQTPAPSGPSPLAIPMAPPNTDNTLPSGAAASLPSAAPVISGPPAGMVPPNTDTTLPSGAAASLPSAAPVISGPPAGSTAALAPIVNGVNNAPNGPSFGERHPELMAGLKFIAALADPKLISYFNAQEANKTHQQELQQAQNIYQAGAAQRAAILTQTQAEIQELKDKQQKASDERAQLAVQAIGPGGISNKEQMKLITSNPTTAGQVSTVPGVSGTPGSIVGATPPVQTSPLEPSQLPGQQGNPLSPLALATAPPATFTPAIPPSAPTAATPDMMFRNDLMIKQAAINAMPEGPQKEAAKAEMSGLIKEIPGTAYRPAPAATPVPVEKQKLDTYSQLHFQVPFDTAPPAQQQQAFDAVQKDEAEKAISQHRAERLIDVNNPIIDPNSKISEVKTVDENGKNVTKFVSRGEALLHGPYKAQVGGTVEARADAAQTVIDTGNDIISKLTNPTVRADLGAFAGRYTTLQQFIGNPPPEYMELAGQIESYSLGSMGVHGMRSAQGAQKITDMLQTKFDPDAIAAAIKGLNAFATHYVTNVGQTPNTPHTPVGSLPPTKNQTSPSTGATRTLYLQSDGKTYLPTKP